jgi:transcriptional/translational regulatory protein YebC/TACO1
VVCAQTAFADIVQTLSARFGDPLSAKFVWRPQTTIPITGDVAQTVLKLIDAIDDLDDVQDVFANFEIDDSELARLNQ